MQVRFKLGVLVARWVAYLERTYEMRYIRRKTGDFEQLAVLSREVDKGTLGAGSKTGK